MFDCFQRKARAACAHLLPLAAIATLSCLSQQALAVTPATPVKPGTPGHPLKVAFVYVGPIGDGGWTYAHDHARRSLEAEFGERIRTTYIENIADNGTAEKTFRELARQGHHVIIGTTHGYLKPMLRVAAEFPAVKFEHATGAATAANLSTYAARTYEGAYLAGVVAGKVSKSGRLGFVASLPIPEVVRNINAYTLGAQSVNPKAVTRVAWVGKWFDPEGERASAMALIKAGADVLIQNTDSAAVLRTAQEQGVMAFGWDSDMTAYGPKAHLGSAAINWTPYYKKVVQDVLEGTWKPGRAWWGVRQNAVRIASPSPELDAATILFLGERMNAMRSGTLKPFAGPLFDQQGNEVVAPGQSPDDRALENMHYLVRGVIGEIPRGAK